MTVRGSSPAAVSGRARRSSSSPTPALARDGPLGEAVDELAAEAGGVGEHLVAWIHGAAAYAARCVSWRRYSGNRSPTCSVQAASISFSVWTMCVCMLGAVQRVQAPVAVRLGVQAGARLELVEDADGVV